MKLSNEESSLKKDVNSQIEFPSKLPSLNIQESQQKQILNSPIKNDIEPNLTPNKSTSSLKLKITEHININSNDTDNNNRLFPNDFYSEESEKNSPKIIDGKSAININEIIGEETDINIELSMIDDSSINLSPGKISSKSFGVITSYAANTNQGIVRDYNEDRVAVNINMSKPKNLNQNNNKEPWPKISYFAVFDGHAGNKCADFLRDNLLTYISNNNYFPKDIPNAIKYGFKKIDEDYLSNYAFINNNLVDNSGSCGLVLLLVNNIIYIANVGDSRCVGSFKNGKILKDITLDHKPNSPYEKERIIKNGGKIYQTQTPIDDDDNFKDKILVGPHRVFPGKLSVSRTVGDAEGKILELGGNPNVLIPLPDIYVFDLEKDDIDFFILGCDGIYDQLSSKEILECAWMVINNNISFLKKKLEGKNIENEFKGMYGNDINMHTTSGNIVDFILKASMIRKSFDNVTCLIISFKNFFENILEEEQNKEKIKLNLNISNPQVKISKEILLRNKSNIENINLNKIENELLYEEKINNKNINLKSQRDEDDSSIKKNNKINNINLKKIKNTKISQGKNSLRIKSLPKHPFSNINSYNLKNKSDDKENIINLSNNNNFIINKISDKGMTVNNIITYNNNIILNSDGSNNNINKLREHNINIINSPILKGINKADNNNILINTSNQIFFTKMNITGINTKKNKIKEFNNINNNIDNNEEEGNRYSSYNKKIRPIIIDNKNDLREISNNNNKDKILFNVPNISNININNNGNLHINKTMTYKKLNEGEYYNKIYGNRNNDINTNIKSDSNIKPLMNNNMNLNKKNINVHKINNKNIKFNNILRANTYGIINYKLKNFKNINLNLKNIKLKKLKTEDIKFIKPMPTLNGNVALNKNNKLEENNFVRQRRFITNDNVTGRSNLSERKNFEKVGVQKYKFEISVPKKNISEFDNKLLIKNMK